MFFGVYFHEYIISIFARKSKRSREVAQKTAEFPAIPRPKKHFAARRDINYTDEITCKGCNNADGVHGCGAHARLSVQNLSVARDRRGRHGHLFGRAVILFRTADAVDVGRAARRVQADGKG